MNLVYMLSLVNQVDVPLTGELLLVTGWRVAPLGGVAGLQPAPAAPGGANVCPSGALAVLGLSVLGLFVLGLGCKFT